MTRLRLSLSLLFCLPAVAAADLDGLPGDTVWYLHADLAAMRSTDSGRELYGWFENEVVEEVREEVGIDLTQEIDRMTAFSGGAKDAVVVVEGPLSRELRDKLMALAVLKGSVDEREHRGKAYFMFEDSGTPDDDFGLAYFTFDVAGKIIVASDEAQLQALIATNGRISGGDAGDGALLILTADKEFVQAGLRPDKLSVMHDGDDWDSSIFRSAERGALLVSDRDGLIAVEAKLIASDPQMTQSIGNIVSGLVSLQALNDELEPPLQQLLQNTDIDVDDAALTISTVVAPDLLRAILED